MSSGRGIAPRSASRKRTTPSPSSCPRRPGVISLVMDGDIERELNPDQLRTRLAQLICGGGAVPTAPGVRAIRSADGVLPLSQHRAEVSVDLHRRRCCGSSWPATASSSGRCARRSSSRTCRRVSRSSAIRRRTSTSGCAALLGRWPAGPGRYVGGHRPAQRASGPAAVPPDLDADPGALRARRRPGGARDAADRVRELGDPHRAGAAVAGGTAGARLRSDERQRRSRDRRSDRSRRARCAASTRR